MDYLFKRKILHCDLTAVNVLLAGTEGDFTAKISDFGWAKELFTEVGGGPYFRNNAKFKRAWYAVLFICSLAVLFLCPHQEMGAYTVNSRYLVVVGTIFVHVQISANLFALRVIWTCKKFSNAKLWLEKAIKMYF